MWDFFAATSLDLEIAILTVGIVVTFYTAVVRLSF